VAQSIARIRLRFKKPAVFRIIGAAMISLDFRFLFAHNEGQGTLLWP